MQHESVMLTVLYQQREGEALYSTKGRKTSRSAGPEQIRLSVALYQPRAHIIGHYYQRRYCTP